MENKGLILERIGKDVFIYKFYMQTYRYSSIIDVLRLKGINQSDFRIMRDYYVNTLQKNI
ncbi:hypothetical protein GCM10008986_02680 [Salinibacillus aidingensis]|uniref:Uncharacterized protein n=1 Tax=Salinibacillus aidingensis TaxID=237684 RepID=A0ABP3KMK8_9BACI